MSAPSIYTYAQPTGVPITMPQIRQMFRQWDEWQKRNIANPTTLGTRARPFPCPDRNSFPYGNPADPVRPSTYTWPYATDVGPTFKDPSTGLYCALNLYCTGLGSTPGPWSLTHSMLSVSFDRVKWLPLSLYTRSADYPDYGAPGPNGERINFNPVSAFIDRENKFGQGENRIILSVDSAGASGPNEVVYMQAPDIFTKPQPFMTSPAAQYVGAAGDGCADGRLMWDPTGQQMMLVAQDTKNVVFFNVDLSTGALTLLSSYNPGAPGRVECPGFVAMTDDSTGAPIWLVTHTLQTDQVLNEFQMAVTGTWDGKTFTATGTPKRLTYGAWEYAGTINDPDQNDGTGGTAPNCAVSQFNTGRFGWKYLGNGQFPADMTTSGLFGGFTPPCDVTVSAGVPYVRMRHELLDYLPPMLTIIANPNDTHGTQAVSPTLSCPQLQAVRVTVQGNFVTGTVLTFDDPLFYSISLQGGGETWSVAGFSAIGSDIAHTADIPIVNGIAELMVVMDGGEVYIYEFTSGVRAMCVNGKTVSNSQVSKVTMDTWFSNNTVIEYWLG